MPLELAIVGKVAGERTLTVTTRDCLAYAAGTDDLNERYLDDARPGGIVAPPLFGVALDWALRPALASIMNMTPEEARQGVHATQDMQFHRPIRPGDTLTVRGMVVQAEARSTGAYLITRYQTVDSAGAPVLTVYYGSLFRGVSVAGTPRTDDAPLPLPAPPPTAAPSWAAPITVSRTAPHVYTECADIYNPIHTERAVALAAGLPDIIIHGTLTLAYAARELLNREAGGAPERLRRIACRFTGMVLPGSIISVLLDAAGETDEGRYLFFSVLAESGAPAIKGGVALIS
jgi:acyl dehydratase